jgi:hypothetical protein
MPHRDGPRPQHAAVVKDLVTDGCCGAADAGPCLSEERKVLDQIELEELRRLAKEGEISGLCEQDGEALLDRLEAKYRQLIPPKSGI